MTGLVGSLVASPPLNCSSPETLLGSYRIRFFLRLAFAEAAALVGFVAVILTGEWWLYLLGAAFTLIGFVRLAPTEKRLLQDQETLNSQGCGLSLHGLMISSMPAPGRPPQPG